MKKLLLIALIAIAIPGTKLLAQATINCTIKNAPQSYAVIEKIITPVSKRDTVQLDANGHFSFTTDQLDDVHPYRIVYSNKKKQNDPVQGGQLTLVIADLADKIDLLLDNTYNLTITLDANNRENTLKITGKGAELSAYYSAKIDGTAEFNKKYGRMMRAPKDSLIAYVDNYNQWSKKLQAQLPAIKYLSKTYISEEAKALKYRLAQIKIYYATSQINKYKNDSILAVLDDNYFSFLKDIPFNNKEDKDDRGYTTLIRVYTDYLMARKNRGARLSEPDRFSQKYDLYKTLFKSDELRDFQMFDMLYSFNSKATESWYEAAVKDFNAHAVNDSLKEEINNILTIRQKMGKGRPAYNFTVYDRDGHTHSLADYKGKFVYIDTWATWCHPCVYEIPYLQKMEEDYKGRPIVFLSVSIDNDSTRWRKYTERRGMHGNLFWAGNDKSKGYLKEYLIQGIPRFILIDPEGNFIDPNAPRPSYPEASLILRNIKELRATAPSQAQANSESSN